MKMDPGITFPSNSFGYIIGTCLTEGIPMTLLLESTPPEVKTPNPAAERISLVDAIDSYTIPVSIYTDDEYDWTINIASLSYVSIQTVRAIPSECLITDSMVVTSEGQTSDTDSSRVEIHSNPGTRDEYLRSEFEIK